MNEIQKDVNFYGNYFTGFHDLYHHNSVKDVALGCLKICSYVTTLGFLPIVFAGAYYYKKSRMDEMARLCDKVHKAVEQVFSNGTPDQNELIAFLSIRVKDQNKTDFEDVFKKLDTVSQAKFFALMDTQGKLMEAMEYIPKDVTHIAFSFADSKDSRRNFNKATETIKKFLPKLDDFKDLKTLQVDLSGVAYYTSQVQQSINQLVGHLNLEQDFAYVGEPYLLHQHVEGRVSKGGLSSLNNIDAVNQAVWGLLKYFKKNDALKNLTIYFERGQVFFEKNEQTKEVKVSYL